VFSSDGAAVKLTVMTLFRLSAAAGYSQSDPIRSDPIHPFCIQRLRLADTCSTRGFAKESLHFLNI
jgi:hypothetical protein